ncbi:MAG: cell division protein FtsQ/DivIB, partial [Planctomycetota bacterium]
MSRRKKGRKTKSDRDCESLGERWISWRSAAIGAGWLSGLSALAAVWILGVPRLEGYASLAEPADTPQIRFAQPPAWLDADLSGRLIAVARRQLGTDPFAQDQLVATRAALLSTGWFETVQQVRRLQRSLIEIEARFAEPRAVVRDSDGDHLIDAHGMLLPTPHPAAEHGRLVTIHGTAAPQPVGLGQRWGGAGLSAALRLLHRVQERPWADQVAAIDVSTQADERVIQLITDR